MSVIFVDRAARCGALRDQLENARVTSSVVVRLEQVAALEPWRIHAVCLVLEEAYLDVGSIRALRELGYAGSLVALGRTPASAALEAGADDLRPLDVSAPELLARIESIRRTSGPFVEGPLTVCPVRRRAWLREVELLDLRKVDFDVL